MSRSGLDFVPFLVCFCVINVVSNIIVNLTHNSYHKSMILVVCCRRWWLDNTPFLWLPYPTQASLVQEGRKGGTREGPDLPNLLNTKPSAFLTKAQSRFAIDVLYAVLCPPCLAQHYLTSVWSPCISVVPEAT